MAPKMLNIRMNSLRLAVSCIVDFIVTNRGSKTFNGLDAPQIEHELQKAIASETLLCSLSPTGVIDGVIVCWRNDSTKVIFVYQVLTIKRGVIKSFVNVFRNRFPDYRLEAMRRDKFIQYNTPKLVSKLSSIK